MSSRVNTQRVLVVDDDKTIADLIVALLGDEEIEACACYSGKDALAVLDRPYGLAILDIMMPGMDGFELCRRIRATSNMPIMFLSAKGDSLDKVNGLSIGADDYVTKPFQTDELVARVKAHLRRSNWTAAKERGSSNVLRIHGLELDILHHECCLNGEPLPLTPKEFELLRILIEQPGVPCSTQKLFEEIWEEPYDSSGGNTIIVHIRRLRKKIAEIDDTHSYITTVWGIGYKIEE